MLKHFHKRKQKGQSTIEYVVLVMIIIGALLTIQVYIKRGIQGRLKSATDDIGDQFSPGNMNLTRVVTTNSSTGETNFQGDAKTTDDQNTTESMNAEIINAEQEYWGSEITH